MMVSRFAQSIIESGVGVPPFILHFYYSIFNIHYEKCNF